MMRTTLHPHSILLTFESTLIYLLGTSFSCAEPPLLDCGASQGTFASFALAQESLNKEESGTLFPSLLHSCWSVLYSHLGYEISLVLCSQLSFNSL